MKRKIISFVLCMSMLASSSSFLVYATDDASNSVVEDDTTTTEATTEAPTEATTQTTTEAPTEATTKAPTPSTETTTKTSTVSDSWNVTIQEGDTKTLDSYISGSLSASSYTWKSNDEDIATVSSSGKAKAVDEGSCIITATATSGGNNYYYAFNITVGEPDFTDTFKVTVNEDKTVDLFKKIDEDDVEDLKPGNFKWEVKNSSYASISSKGVVTGKKKGSTTVTAYYVDSDDVLYYEFKITIKESSSSNDDKNDSNKNTSSNVSKKTSWKIYLGTDDELDISMLLEDDPDDYDWDVSDDDIVEVNEKTGKLEALEEGDSKVYAEGDDDYTFSVEVDDDYSNDEQTVKVGKTVDLEDLLDDDADEYSFSSDRTAVATVNSDGVVTGKANGVCSIVCKHDDGDIIQVFITVSGGTTTTTTSTTTTVEATTEATTSTVTTTSATTTTRRPVFNDISQRPWATEAINNMVGKGFIVGRNSYTFAPDDTCTRADFTIVLTKILDINVTKTSTNYSDVAAGTYFYDYVLSAKGLSIEAGVKDGKFRPTDAITREEIMVMAYKGLVYKGVTMNTDTSVLSKYTDLANVAEENKPAVAALVNAGVITGTSSTILDVKSNITRAQMAVLLNNVYKMI